jgi:hypothetical protein
MRYTIGGQDAHPTRVLLFNRLPQKSEICCRNIGKLKDEKINQVIAKIIEILQKPSEPPSPVSKAWERGKNPKSIP